MGCVYGHTNLVVRDWQAMRAFYVEVFGCEPVGPERDMSGPWLDACTGLRNARLRGQHLRLPGSDQDGPTLEIFEYDATVEQSDPTSDRLGYGHLAFRVDDVAAMLDAVIAAGGSRLGDVAETDVAGVGHLTVVYACDPEGNIVELQRWT